ncbi:MAG: helix-turn-helix domain-containing protein [Solirubrobacteraceae bacterium]
MARAGYHRHGSVVDRVAHRAEQSEARVVLGIALRALRKRSGLTQEQLAACVGLTTPYVSEIENGKRGLRWFTVMRFLGAVDATLHDLAEEVDRASDTC